jgi:hypothetical protein
MHLALRPILAITALLAVAAGVAPWSGGAAATALSASPPSGLLMGAFLPARDCPRTAAGNREAPVPDLWPEAVKRACLMEMAADIAAGVELVRDLFVRLTDAYEAYDNSANGYERFWNSSWRLARDRSFAQQYWRRYESAMGTAATYDAALVALTTALQTHAWVAEVAPAALTGRLGRRTFVLAPAPEVAPGGLGLSITGSGARPRGVLPDPFAAVPIDAPLPLPPAPMSLPAALPSPMPVFFYGEMKFTGSGVFVTRTAHQLGAWQGSVLFEIIQDQVCEISPDLCRLAVAPESAANATLDWDGIEGRHAAFIAAPGGYSVCRVAVAWNNVSMPREATFAARIERTFARDGVALEASGPEPFRSANWISASVLVSFVREDRLSASACWPDGTAAWNCRSRFCADIKLEARFEMPPRQDRPVVCLDPDACDRPR